MISFEEQASRGRHPAGTAHTCNLCAAQIALRPTAEVLAEWPDADRILTDIELRRARAFHTQQDQDDFLAAHLLARHCVSQLTGVAVVTISQRCAECGGDHGRPAVWGYPEVTVSWSHTRGYVGAVAAFDPVGIDLESVNELPDDLTSRAHRGTTPIEAVRILAAPDPARAYLRTWVAKEALTKVGVLAAGNYSRVDVRGGTYCGYDLTVTEHEQLVVGLARRSVPL